MTEPQNYVTNIAKINDIITTMLDIPCGDAVKDR